MAIKNFKLAKGRAQSDALIEEALNVVGMRGEEVLEKYPHQLSGGQRQRMMVARAYMLKPRLIVADEPVSMVDASLRAMILDIMLRLRDQHHISFLYITHDLSTAYQIGDRIYLLYQGAVAEHGQTTDVIEKPKHPYVQLLIDSIPVPDPKREVGWRRCHDAGRRADACQREERLPLLRPLRPPHGPLPGGSAAALSGGRAGA